MNFSNSINFTLQWEGGYVNHPADPGGPTNMGITQKTYERWVGHPVTDYDIAMLTVEDVKPIYKQNYWDEVSGDQLPEGINLLAFDFAVNSGPRRAIMKLQKLFPGIAVDGVIGPITLGVIREDYDSNPYALIDDYCDERQLFVQSLSTFNVFGRGWTRRIDAARDEAKRMV